jgi:hypothetical protein
MNTIDNIMELREFCANYLEYVDGVLYWKQTALSPKMRGKKAGSLERKGYIVLYFNGKAHKCHRLIFLMHHGYLPHIVDHINGDPLDNRIENLRAATHTQNTNNAGPRKGTRSGLKGVSQIASGKWQAAIRAEGRRLYLGAFDTPELAHVAYVNAAKQYHKDFARTV